MTRSYAFKNNNQEVMNSSSGGAFIALCHAFEDKHGKENVVFSGACFGEDMNVIHRCVYSSNECTIFQGSKYVRSDMGKVFEELKDLIFSGKYVLFSGIPCQVFAFKKYMDNKGISMEKYTTIDIICHGAPKKEVWNDYKNWLENKVESKLVKYSFRYKPEGWKAYPVYARFENGRTLVNTADTSVYSKLHLPGYSLSKSCFSCKFSSEKREGDITLGDYWGVEQSLQTIDYKNGVSLVLSNSKKGQELIELINLVDTDLIETFDKGYLKYQHNLNSPTIMPKDYYVFWQDYCSMNFDSIISKYLNYGVKYKIAFFIKKVVRKTPLIELIRRSRGR